MLSLYGSDMWPLNTLWQGGPTEDLWVTPPSFPLMNQGWLLELKFFIHSPSHGQIRSELPHNQKIWTKWTPPILWGHMGSGRYGGTPLQQLYMNAGATGERRAKCCTFTHFEIVHFAVSCLKASPADAYQTAVAAADVRHRCDALTLCRSDDHMSQTNDHRACINRSDLSLSLPVSQYTQWSVWSKLKYQPY